jgi:hypothetical protein
MRVSLILSFSALYFTLNTTYTQAKHWQRIVNLLHTQNTKGKDRHPGAFPLPMDQVVYIGAS